MKEEEPPSDVVGPLYGLITRGVSGSARGNSTAPTETCDAVIDAAIGRTPAGLDLPARGSDLSAQSQRQVLMAASLAVSEGLRQASMAGLRALDVGFRKLERLPQPPQSQPAAGSLPTYQSQDGHSMGSGYVHKPQQEQLQAPLPACLAVSQDLWQAPMAAGQGLHRPPPPPLRPPRQQQQQHQLPVPPAAVLGGARGGAEAAAAAAAWEGAWGAAAGVCGVEGAAVAAMGEIDVGEMQHADYAAAAAAGQSGLRGVVVGRDAGGEPHAAAGASGTARRSDPREGLRSHPDRSGQRADLRSLPDSRSGLRASLHSFPVALVVQPAGSTARHEFRADMALGVAAGGSVAHEVGGSGRWVALYGHYAP